MEEGKSCGAETKKEDVESSVVPTHDGECNGVAADDHKPVIVHGELRRLTGPARRSSKANWTEKEDDILRDAVQKYEGKCWKKIAESLPGRTDVQCLHRWQKVLKPDLVKGHWSKEEDNLLTELVGKFSEKKWSEIAEQFPGRMGKQCRERWYNHLKPEINKAAWTEEEERILINSHAIYGNKWSILAKLLPGRTENSVKNHWNCSLKKRLGNYSAGGSAVNRVRSTIPPMHVDNKGTSRKFVDAKQNLSTNCLCKERVDCGRNGESSSLDLLFFRNCGTFSSHPSSSSVKSKNLLRPSPSTCSRTTGQTEVFGCTSLDENNLPHGTYGHCHKPCLVSSSCPETLLPCPNSPFHDKRCSDRDFIVSCSIRPRRHSDICHNIQSSSDWSYTGLCYKPIQKADLNIFLATGRFPSTESYIRQPRSISVPPSRSYTKESSDLYSSAKSILRSAAMSYGNMPSIIRKRAIQALRKDVSASDKVVGSLNRTVPRVEHDQVQILRNHALCSPKHQRLDKFAAATKSVGKCLEREFSEA